MSEFVTNNIQRHIRTVIGAVAITEMEFVISAGGIIPRSGLVAAIVDIACDGRGITVGSQTSLTVIEVIPALRDAEMGINRSGFARLVTPEIIRAREFNRA